MLKRISSLFSKNAAEKDRDFQRRVCLAISELSPVIVPIAATDPLLIEVGDVKIGLLNLRSKFNASSQTDDDLREIVAEHLAVLLETQQGMESENPSWNDAAPIIMPQLVTEERFSGMPILTFPFCSEVKIAFVLDSDRTMRYVTEEMFATWEINIKQALDRAVDNLETRSNDLSATSVPDTLIAVRSMDSFDAARILSPAVREVIVNTVGSPFLFGVPNRDFLICWSKNSEAATSELWGTQIRIDHEEQPYPISAKIFECGDDGRAVEVVSR